jgi:hypothetical protein
MAAGSDRRPWCLFACDCGRDVRNNGGQYFHYVRRHLRLVCPARGTLASAGRLGKDARMAEHWAWRAPPIVGGGVEAGGGGSDQTNRNSLCAGMPGQWR